MRAPLHSTSTPGAVPTGLGIGLAPFGSFAIFTLLSVSSPLYFSRTISRARSSRTSSTPIALANPSTVMSSKVGPKPPVETTTRAPRSTAVAKAQAMRSKLSATTRQASTLYPRSVSLRPSQAAFVLTTLPISSSLPTDTR
jgi:hypothetical protein